MQVETRVGRRLSPHLEKRFGRAQRKVVVALAGLPLLLLGASSPAQASTTPQSMHWAALTTLTIDRAPTLMPMFTGCVTFHQSRNLTAWGYVNVGYTEIDVGVCYTNNVPSIQWGPFCSAGWYVPFIRMSALNYCTWWRNSNGSITLYGSWTGQIWIPFVGWTGDRTFTESYGV